MCNYERIFIYNGIIIKESLSDIRQKLLKKLYKILDNCSENFIKNIINVVKNDQKVVQFDPYVIINLDYLIELIEVEKIVIGYNLMHL